MVIKKILVPTDGSEHAKKAMEMAVEIAKSAGGSIEILYVVDRSLGFATPDDGEIINNVAREIAEKAIDDIKGLAQEAGVESTERIVSGEPAPQILKESDGFDMIVMSSVGKSGLNKLLFGSVSQEVVGKCKCPVLVTKPA